MCPSFCSFHGVCDIVAGCICSEGWVGDDCSVPQLTCDTAMVNSVKPSGGYLTASTTINIAGTCLDQGLFQCVFSTVVKVRPLPKRGEN